LHRALFNPGRGRLASHPRRNGDPGSEQSSNVGYKTAKKGTTRHAPPFFQTFWAPESTFRSRSSVVPFPDFPQSFSHLTLDPEGEENGKFFITFYDIKFEEKVKCQIKGEEAIRHFKTVFLATSEPAPQPSSRRVSPRCGILEARVSAACQHVTKSYLREGRPGSSLPPRPPDRSASRHTGPFRRSRRRASGPQAGPGSPRPAGC